MPPTDSVQTRALRGFRPRALSENPGAERVAGLTSVMVNVGLRCNLACEMCHHSSSPERTESMSRSTMLETLRFIAEVGPVLVDITGGEPSLWPLLGEFVAAARPTAARIRVRTNLDALLLPGMSALLATLAENRVEVLASLPEALEGRTVGGSIEALRRLGALGWGNPEDGAPLPLDLAYNPLPGDMPRSQPELAEEFRAALAVHGIAFRDLIAIANFPVGGFERWLDQSGLAEEYLDRVEAAFNPATLHSLSCRHGIEVGWDGTLWDCDFNMAARIPLAESPCHVGAYLGSPAGQMALASRRISFAEHCFACAAGAGSG